MSADPHPAATAGPGPDGAPALDPDRVEHARARLPSADDAVRLTGLLSLMADPVAEGRRGSQVSRPSLGVEFD
jgi:hypothetical protein